MEHAFLPKMSLEAVINRTPFNSLLLFFVCGALKSKLKEVFRLPKLLMEAIDLVNFNAKSSVLVKSNSPNWLPWSSIISICKSLIYLIPFRAFAILNFTLNNVSGENLSSSVLSSVLISIGKYLPFF